MKRAAMGRIVEVFQKIKMPLFIKIFFAADFALAFVYLFDMVLGKPFRFLTGIVDLDGEANLPSWYSSVQLFLVAILWAVFVNQKFRKEEKRSWILLLVPVVFSMLSLDEVAQIHEYIGWKSDALLPSGRRSETPFPKTGIWMFVLLPPFLGLVLALVAGVRRYVHVPRDISGKFVAGFILFIGSATGTEILSNFVIGGGMASSLQIALEELGEMLGVTVMLWATYDLLSLYRVKIDFGREYEKRV